MKKKRILFIIAISALSLVGLVLLQISWIRHAAELRRDQLEHRLALASYLIKKRIYKDSTLKYALDATAAKQPQGLLIMLPHTQRARIDSLIKVEFRYHQITLPYSFELINKSHTKYAHSCHTDQPDSHPICLEGVLPTQNAELRIRMYQTSQFIFAEMGWMLVASFMLIGLVMACFMLTIWIIWRQKKLSEMTADFINNMTHELKTPISTIALASNMLRKKQIIANTDKIIHYSGIIHEENDKLQAQVEQVLRIAKLERGDFKLNKVRTDLNDIIQNAIHTIDLQVRTRGGQITCYLNAFKSDIEADVTHLTNVVANLLDNANKYSPDTPEIVISTHDREDGVVISVEDKGIGMSKDKQKYIFDKFYRVPTGNLHDVKGYGLGLTYVKMMVDAHHGQISLMSEPGKGSRFDIFLPLK